ncbi:MAG: hypothetical protein AAGA77_14410 [Bacteroidota bacterium]
MFLQKIEFLSRSTIFLMVVFLLASCDKEILNESEKLNKTMPTAVDYSKTLSDYPSEMTIDNWRQFIDAPPTVMKHFAEKERQGQSTSLDQDIRDLNSLSNSRTTNHDEQIFTFDAAGNLVYIEGVDILNENNSATTTSFAPPTSFPINFVIPGDENHSFCYTYDTPVLNGVTTFDLVLITKHLLGIECFTTPKQYIAADADRNGHIEQDDVDLIQDVILHILPDFPNSQNVVFVWHGEYTTMEGMIQPCSLDPIRVEINGNQDPCMVGSAGARYAIKTGDLSGNFSF